jgi:hypothetical protein
MLAGGGQQNFKAGMRKQRSSLVMTKVDGVKTVLGCSGMVYETGVGAAGYCFAFDVATNKLTAMLPLTAGEGAGAGVWMGGQGAAADDQGNLYLITLNGDFDGETQWGKSFSKLRYTPAANGRRRTSLWWTTGRRGRTLRAASKPHTEPAKLAGMSVHRRV